MAKRGATARRQVRSTGRLEIATAAAVAVGALAILVAERRRRCGARTQSEPRRELQNLVLGAGCALMVSLAETPVVEPLARRAERGTPRTGAEAARAPPWARDLLGVVLMDYTFYLWHVLTHKVPALWRLHLVHHVDLDLDASTAVRFHAVDMLVSAPWRYAQVALIGLSPAGVRLWRAFFFLSILFHHSNLRLPERWERRLAWVLTTPRMHGIHHSAVQERDGLELVQRPLLLGSPARHLPPRRIAVRHHHRCARLSLGGGCRDGSLARHAVSSPAPRLAGALASCLDRRAADMLVLVPRAGRMSQRPAPNFGVAVP